MLTPEQQARLDRKCLAAATTAINTFNACLKQCDAEDAAAIIADLIKANLAKPAAQPDPSAALAAVVSRIMSEE